MNQSGAIFGDLTHAGTMSVGDDREVTGVFVRMVVEDLRAVAHLPMYRRVKIVTASEWNERIGERDHLVGALREIQRIWRTQSEACADNSRAGELMAEAARKATAYLEQQT
jgi:hypothetical protein